VSHKVVEALSSTLGSDIINANHVSTRRFTRSDDNGYRNLNPTLYDSEDFEKGELMEEGQHFPFHRAVRGKDPDPN
jgi:hypothetical protein